MFGSLVIIFPTHHEGGTLVLRDGGKEWTIDAASEMRSKSHPCVTYIAFYGDVEHEVLPITAGYRVTVTYNLYFNSTPVPLYSKIVDASYQQLKHAFEEMLTDSNTLPDGGYLGFGLRRRYGLTHSTKLDTLSENLKGGDALIMEVCRDLSLDVCLRILYHSDEPWHRNEPKPDDILVDRSPDLQGYCFCEPIVRYIMEECPGAVRVARSLSFGLKQRETTPDITIEWVLDDIDNGEVVQNTVVAYGNEPAMKEVYGRVCLIIAVGPPHDRLDTKKIKSFTEQYENREDPESDTNSEMQGMCSQLEL